MALINCFWSYAHDDQDHDGRILDLVKDVIGEFKAIMGEEVESYFLDIEQLKWGDEWPKKLDEYIANMPIFIPIITPTYFNKPYCTYELRTFITKLDEKLGKTHSSLMPILYIDVPEIRNDKCGNDLIRRISSTQYKDWTANRFEERTSKAYRIGVNEIAEALRAKSEEIEKIVPVPVSEEIPDDDEEDGILERMNNIDVSVQDVESTLLDATVTASEIAGIITQELDSFNQSKANKSASTLLSIFNRLSSKLVQPVEDMYDKALTFVNCLATLNSSVPALIQFMELMDSSDEEQRNSICRLRKSMLFAGESIRDLVDSISKNIDAIEPLAKMSRSLRPVIRKLVSAFNLMKEVLIAYEQGVKVLETWNLNCEDEIPRSD